MPVLRHATGLPHDHREVFAWHERPGAFQRLVPPHQRVRVLAHRLGDGSLIGDGAEVEIALEQGPLTLRWLARHDGYRPGHRFRDTQVTGPFAHWVHTHRFVRTGDNLSDLIDEVRYAPPGGAIGKLLGGWMLERDLGRTFRWRHRRTEADLARHAPFVGQRPLRVVMTGSGGLIGSQLAAFLTTGGHRVDRLVRDTDNAPPDNSADNLLDNSPDAIALRGGRVFGWDPTRADGTVDASALDGADAVVHLAGAPVAKHPWNDSTTRAIRESRVNGTRLIADAIARCPNPPGTLITASAVGLYGDRPGELLTEDSAAGDGFLAETTRAWEAAAQPAVDAGVRVVFARIGIVLNAKGGALHAMLPAARLGLLGRLGTGAQHWPWIGLDDGVGALHHLLMTDSARGPINLVAPGAETGGTTQVHFARTLARVLRRPAGPAAPGWLLRAALGSRFADETILASQRVSAGALLATGFRFRTPGLEDAIAWETGSV